MSRSSSETTGRTYRQQTGSERRAERRAKLLDAALELFGAQGYPATPVDQICSTARVSTRNFYEEFANREAVLVELHDLVNDRAFDAVAAATASLPAEDDLDALRTRIETGVRAYFETMTSDPRYARVALVESVGVSPEVDAARRRAIDRFAVFLEAELDRLADVGLAARRDHSLTAVAIVGAINELVTTWPVAGGATAYLDRLVDEGARLIVALVQAP